MSKRRTPGTPRTEAAQAKIAAMWRECPYCGSEPGTYYQTEFGTILCQPRRVADED